MSIELEEELKKLLIKSLDLEDVAIEDIASDEALFGDGLGLDSIDALELGLAISKKYGIKIDAENEDTKMHFASISNLVKFIQSERML